jgi:hypothetical protein
VFNVQTNLHYGTEEIITPVGDPQCIIQYDTPGGVLPPATIQAAGEAIGNFSIEA